MQMPVQLYALIWSNEDRKAIEDWAEQHSDKVAIVGFSRVLLEPLHTAAQDPNIFGLAIDGVVIPDHNKWPADSLKQCVTKFNAGMLKLYSATNGVEPVTLQNPVQF
jgi:hypothetical protein